MTGTGLVKFERFTAINKLPWDDVNDQFVIQVRVGQYDQDISLTPPQEPGVYAVFVTAILQDATLSVKIASNMLEREVTPVQSNTISQFISDFQCGVSRGFGGMCHAGLRLKGRTAPGTPHPTTCPTHPSYSD